MASCVLLVVFICYSLVMYEVIVRIQQTRRTGATGAQLIKSLKRTFLKVGLYPFLMLICLLPGK